MICLDDTNFTADSTFKIAPVMTFLLSDLSFYLLITLTKWPRIII
jgi:hypothetical protein